jgi:hypothetical protein
MWSRFCTTPTRFPRNRWSETPEGHATRDRAFRGVSLPAPRHRRAWAFLVAATVVLTIVASVTFVASQDLHESEQAAVTLDWTHGRWSAFDSALLANLRNIVRVWTGSELVFLGTENGSAATTGSAWNPRTQQWRPVPMAPLSAREIPVVAWTGREILVWGGEFASDAHNDGAAYPPSADTWRILSASPLTPRGRPVAAWTESELVILGGDPCLDPSADCSAVEPNAAAYDPGRDAWRVVQPPPEPLTYAASGIWDRHQVLVIDPVHGLIPRNYVAGYNPRTDTWTTVPTPGPQSLGGSPVESAQRVATFTLQNPAVLTAYVFDPRDRTWSSATSKMAGSACEPYPTAVRGGAVVACRDAVGLLDVRKPRWRPMPQPSMSVGPLVSTGLDVFRIRRDREHLLRYRPRR